MERTTSISLGISLEGDGKVGMRKRKKPAEIGRERKEK